MIARTPRTIWYVVADGARARILARRSDESTFSEVTALLSATGHLKSKDLGSDRPGRAFSSAASGVRHAVESRGDFHDKGEAEFARTVSASINDGAERNAFQDLVLIAPARAALGIREALSRAASDCLVEKVPKDLTKLPEHELHTRLLDLPIAVRGSY